MTRHATPLAVVGGGIGGLATALALGRAGHAVQVVEQAPVFGEIGHGLQMGPNAVRVLDRLDVLRDVVDLAVRPRYAILLDAITGEELTRLDLGARFLGRFGHPYLVMHRGDLHTALLNACRRQPAITLRTAWTVSAVTDHGDATVTVHSAEEDITASGVIGADGLHSVVRRLLDTSEPDCGGYVAYRGTLPAAQVDSAAGDDVLIWIGPYLHLVQYPIRGGELYNQVAVFGAPAYTQGLEPWGTPDELDDRFSITCDAVRAAIATIDRGRHWPMLDRTPLPTWQQGRVTLLGDAAHPMLQYLGQGACQALEDAVVLAEQVDQRPGDLPAAFAEYERRRRPRASRCQEVARPWGRLWHSDDPMTRGLRNRIMRDRAWDDYRDVDWLYAPPTPADAPTAHATTSPEALR